MKTSHKILFTFIIAFFITGCTNQPSYYESNIKPINILSLPYKNKSYGYIFLTHKKVWGNPTLSHLVIDNCRYAGIFYSDTFLVVKLLPGKHVIRIIRPPEIYDLQNNKYIANAKGNKIRLTLPEIKGNEVYVYDMEIGWKYGMVLKQINLNELKNTPVSIDCIDCIKNPTYEEVFGKKCNFFPNK